MDTPSIKYQRTLELLLKIADKLMIFLRNIFHEKNLTKKELIMLYKILTLNKDMEHFGLQKHI